MEKVWHLSLPELLARGEAKQPQSSGVSDLRQLVENLSLLFTSQRRALSGPVAAGEHCTKLRCLSFQQGFHLTAGRIHLLLLAASSCSRAELASVSCRGLPQPSAQCSLCPVSSSKPLLAKRLKGNFKFKRSHCSHYLHARASLSAADSLSSSRGMGCRCMTHEPFN